MTKLSDYYQRLAICSCWQGGFKNGAQRNVKADQLHPALRHNVNRETESIEDTEIRQLRKPFCWRQWLCLNDGSFCEFELTPNVVLQVSYFFNQAENCVK